MTLAPQPAQLSGRRAGDDGVRLLSLAVLEHAGALQHERAGPGADASDESLEPDERRRAVAAVHHQVLDLSFTLDVAGEALGHARARQFRLVLTFVVGLFVPSLDGEPCIRGLLHWLWSVESGMSDTY